MLVETEPVNEGQFSPLPDPWVAVLQHQTIDRLLSVRLVLQHAQECGVLQSRYEDTERNVRNDLRSVGFSAKLVKRNITRMRHFVERLTWTRGRSTWSDYTDYSTYDDSNRGRKKQFVLDAVRTRLRACIWDLGCNTGEYWRLVSSDADQVASVDPGFGWRHAGRQTLDDRGRPDLVPALAAGPPAGALRQPPASGSHRMVRELQCDLVIEFVAPEDPMVKKSLRNRATVDFGYTQEHFETCFSEHFTFSATERLQSGLRTVYFARPKRTS